MLAVKPLTPEALFSLGTVIPVVVLSQLNQTLPLAKSLLDKGIRVMEITLRTPVALEAIRILNDEIPEMVVGAGTVLSPLQLDQCVQAGAQFALSPGSTPELLMAGKQAGIPYIPGIASVSELMQGMSYGYTHFKFFPAEAIGGTPLLKSIYGPFPTIRFCPTGGINELNYMDYLALPNVSCVGGSWVV